MFLFFFEDYKEKVYNGSRRKLTWYEKVMIAFMLISVTLLLLAVSLKWNNIVVIVFASMVVLSVAVIMVYSDIRFQRNRRALLEKYKTGHIEPLIDLLNSYNLYSADGVTWLIDCCNGKKNKDETFAVFKKIKELFLSVIYPVITLSIGLVLAESTPNEIYSFLGLVIALFIIAAIICMFARPLISFMMFPDKEIVDYLEDELKYVKTQLNS